MGSDPLARSGPTWGFDAELLSTLRVQQARAAMEAERPDLALVEAEELLDAYPDDLVALRIAGEAALRLGDAPTAVVAFDGIVRRRLDDVDGWAALGRAQLEAAQLDAALDACQRALDLIAQHADASPDLHIAARAEACFVRGLVRVRRGLAGAEQDFETAQLLAPTRFPRPDTPPQPAFDAALARVLPQLPTAAAQLLAEVPIRWAAFPEPSAAQPDQPVTAPLAWARPELALQPGGEWPDRPNAIVLFKDNLAWPPCDADALVDRILGALCDVVEAWTDPQAHEDTPEGD